MSSVNRVHLLGRLGQDPELRQTQGGQPVTNLNLATNASWTKDGERHERTEWHQVVVWGNQAEQCARYLTKGRLAYVEGRIQSREYTDRDGAQRRAFEIVADRVVFISDGSRDNEHQRGNNGGAPQKGPCHNGWRR